MIYNCPRCKRDNDIGDVHELHDGLRLCCMHCPEVTRLSFDNAKPQMERPQPPPGERGAKEA